MAKYPIKVKTSYSNCRHFQTQKECSEFLNISNSSKKAIEARCRVLNYEVEYENRI